MRRGFLRQDGEAQTVRQHSDLAAWRAANPRGAGSHARDPEQRSALPGLPEAERRPPLPRWLLPPLLGARALMCSFICFFCLSIF